MPIFTTTITGSSYTSSISNAVGFVGTASSAISASFATTASAATSITFTPTTASFAATASYALTSAGTVTNANTASYVTSNIGSGAPMVVNTNNGSGLVLQGTGNSQTAQLRIVANTGGWVDGINTAYFQISSSTGNNVSVMGGTFGADAPFDRLQFNSKYTQFSNGLYSASPLPGYVLQVLNLTSSTVPVFGILATGSQTANFFDITTSGSAAGNIFSIRSNGTVSASGNIEAAVNLVSNNSVGDEGGEINLARAQTNTSISGSMVIDVFQNKLRIYEKNSPNRGGYWDVTTLASGVGTNLAGGAGTVTSVTAGNGLTGGTITGAGTITLDTGSAHFITGSIGVLNARNVVSSSLQINTGSFSGSITTASFATTASAATSITFTPTTASFSTTASAATSITFTPNTASFATTASAATSITFTPTTASFATTASAATSITFTPATASFATTASAATSITFIPNSASFATTASFVNYANIGNRPTLVSSSTQINTGSFTGSFIGTLSGSTFGTASWAQNAISSSFATTASYALNAGSGGVTINSNVDNYVVTATGTANTVNGEVALQFDGTSRRLTVSGSVSSSGAIYLQTGSTLFLGGTGTPTSKQVSGGPEAISFQRSATSSVLLWSGLSSDTEGRFLISANGFTEWGQGGASDQDIALFRNEVGNVSVQSFNTSSARTFQVMTSQSVEVFGVDTRAGSRRVRVNNAAGGATFDLKGDSGITAFRIEHAAAGDIGFSSFVTGDGFIRFYFAPNGDMYWGSGTAAADIYLRRSSTRNLAVQPIGGDTTTTFRVLNSAGSDVFSVDTTNTRVGVGTTSPANTLQIAGNVSASSYTSSINNAVGYFGTASWAVSASRASSSNGVDVLSGGSTSALGTYSGSFSGSFFGNILSGGTANYIPLWTSTNAQSSSIIYQSSGNIGVGTLSPSVKFEVSGSQRITSGSLGVNVAPNATVGRIDASNDIVAYSSDDRLKTNVQPISEPLNKIQNLSGFTYTWNNLAQRIAGFSTESKLVGVYAQEVQSVLPEAVKLAPFDNDGTDRSISGENYLTVQYEKIVPLLIEAIKELKAEVDDLKRKIE